MLQIISSFLLGNLFLIQIQTATPLNCFKCKETNEASCLTIQNESKCHSDRNGACITVTYASIKDGSRTTSYMKGCQESKAYCDGYCNRPDVVDDVEDCQVSCCTGDLCNRFGFVKKEVIKDNRKRATNEKSAGNCNNNISLALIIVGIIFYNHVTLWSR